MSKETNKGLPQTISFYGIKTGLKYNIYHVSTAKDLYPRDVYCCCGRMNNYANGEGDSIVWESEINTKWRTTLRDMEAGKLIIRHSL